LFVLIHVGFEDLLGKFEENNFPPSSGPTDTSDPFSLISSLDAARRDEIDAPSAGKTVTVIVNLLLSS
jgi:hypothetical protein